MRACRTSALLAGLWVLGLLAAQNAAAGPLGFSVRSEVDGHLFAFDLVTGVATDLGEVGLEEGDGLSFAGSDLFAIAGTVDEFWNITTPPGSLVGATGSRTGQVAGLSFDSTSGIMYNLNGASVGPGLTSLYRIDLSTGDATLVGSGTDDADGLAIDAAGQAFASDALLFEGLYSVDLSTGNLTPIGQFGFPVRANSGLSFDEAGNLWMLLSNGAIYEVDPTSGAATYSANVTLDGANIFGFGGLAIIPEPSTALLLGAGLVGLGLRRPRR